MTSEKDQMKIALSQIVVPELRILRFKGTFPHFRRLSDDRLNLLSFQFNKYGGSFVIEIANCKPEGYTTSWGKKILPNKLTVFDLYKRERLDPQTSPDKWYHYDLISLKEVINIYESISNEVLSKLDIAKDYWLNGEMN